MGQGSIESSGPAVCEPSKGCKPDEAQPLAAKASSAWADELAKVTAKVEIRSQYSQHNRQLSHTQPGVHLGARKLLKGCSPDQAQAFAVGAPLQESMSLPKSCYR